MRVDPTAGTGDKVMSDAGMTIGVHFPGRRLRLFTFAMNSEASASLVVAKRRSGRGSSLRSGPARIQQCKTALCLHGGRVWDAGVSQVQLHIGLYAKSSYRGFLVAPYDSVHCGRSVCAGQGAPQ